jgi:hypothetical protein
MWRKLRGNLSKILLARYSCTMSAVWTNFVRSVIVALGGVAILGVCGCGGEGATAGKKTIIIGRGVALAGSSYVVLAERGGPRAGLARSRGELVAPTGIDCPVFVAFPENGEPAGGGMCMSVSATGGSVITQCIDGREVVELPTAPTTRHVVMTLSSGQKATSAVVVVPAAFGGPIGVYYQAVAGVGPKPLSLTEINRRGRKTRTLHVPPVGPCRGEPTSAVPRGEGTGPNGSSTVEVGG